VRPSINFLGMGRYAKITWIENSTDHLYPSDFWCEIFKGDHLSVDFHYQEPKLVVKGYKDDDDPLYKWKKWEKINKSVEFPIVLKKLKGNYDWINCEFIDGNLIEVHVRQNPDFRYDNEVAIPNWDENINEDVAKNAVYIQDLEYNTYGRRGIFVK